MEHGTLVNQDVQPMQGSSALTAAAQNGSIVEVLLKHGADPHDASALQRAVFWEADEVAIRLVELGADVKASPSLQDEAHGARDTAMASARSLSMFRYLVAHGANVNGAPSENGGATAVKNAAAFSSTEILDEPFRLGGDVNAPAATVRGRTASKAAYQGRASHVRLLVDVYGAVINVPRNTKLSKFSILEAAAHYRAKQKPERSGTSDREPEKSDSLNTVEFLLGRGAELTTFPLHIAAAWGDGMLGELLLKNGADPNLPPTFQITFPIVQSWGEDRDMGSNVWDAARLNESSEFLMFLDHWCKVY